MFDVSFGELLLILIVGLLVFGPEKLPGAVRTASLWMARFRRSFNQIRTDIEREVGIDDIKRDIHNQSLLDSLRDVKNDLTGAQRDLEQLPYDLDRSMREGILVEKERIERAKAEVDSALAAIPNDDFKHSDTSVSAQELDRQSQEIASSVQPAIAPANIGAPHPEQANPARAEPEKPAADKTARRS